MKGPENILRQSEALLIMSLLVSTKGMEDPIFKKAFKHLPEALKAEILSIVCDSRSIIQKMTAIKKALAGHVNEPDPYDILKSLPDFDPSFN